MNKSYYDLWSENERKNPHEPLTAGQIETMFARLLRSQQDNPHENELHVLQGMALALLRDRLHREPARLL